jgi:succinate-semialdehyde dehydrogenase/glutarate-semialdehyde dehydrogenase
VIGKVAHAGVADLERAVAAARRGFGVWRTVPAYDRAAMMRKAASLLRKRADPIARLTT